MTHKDLLQEVRTVETEALDLTKVKTTATVVDTDLEGGWLKEVAMISESVHTAMKSAQERDHVHVSQGNRGNGNNRGHRDGSRYAGRHERGPRVTPVGLPVGDVISGVLIVMGGDIELWNVNHC